MSTSDAGAEGLAAAMAAHIEQLANELFKGSVAAPGGASPAAANLAGVPATSGVPSMAGAPAALHPGQDASLAPAVPPFGRALPNGMNVGAGGVSSALTAPPLPGFLHRPPLAAAPPPKESDLRAIPTLASEMLGFPSPIAVASAPFAEASAPYFLGLAGLPSGAPSAAPPSADPLASLPVHAGDAAQVPALPATPATPATPPASQDRAPAAAAQYDFNPELVPDLPKTPGIFDAHAIKKDFPILNERVHGRPLVWLDNAATTQKPRAVIERISFFYEHENSNVHRAAHELAARATDAYEGARQRVARFVGAPSEKTIVWVRGATEGINLVAQSWGRRYVGAGDEIVITWLEHHANIVPWQMLCAQVGARLRVAPVDDTGQIRLEEYERLLGSRTRIVAFPQVSNALGTVTPAREMIEMAHRHGARVLLDGAQSVSHMPVDVRALDCDFFVFSGHKVFAPTGIGAVYGKPEVLDSMPPWQGGGNMIADVTFEKTSYQPPPGRFEAGTGSIADAVGLGAAVDYLSGLGLANVQRYEHELLEYAEAKLATVPGLTMIGTAKEKAAVMSFVLDGLRTEDVGAALDQEGIAVRSGHHCAQPILRRFGVESTVRASLAPYNTKEDIDALVAALRRLQAGRPVSGI